MLFSSHLLCFRFREYRDFSSHLVSSFLLFVVQITLSVIIMGSVLKALNPVALGLVNTAVSSAIILYRRKHIRGSMDYLLAGIKGFGSRIRKNRDYLLILLLILFLIQVAATLVKIYYLPPHVGDVLAYHLHPVAEWFQQGQLASYTDSPVWRANNNPLGAKYLHLWFVLFPGNITWIELPQFLFGLMLVLSCYGIMTRMGVSGGIAARIAILIYFIPALLLHSRTSQDHLILAACTMTALLFVIDILFKQRHDRIIFLGLVLAYLFGVKKHSPLVIGIIVPALLFSQGFNWHKIRDFFRANRRRIFAGLSIIILSAVYFVSYNENFSNKMLRLVRNNLDTFLLKMMLPLAALLVFWLAAKYLVKMAIKKWPGLKTIHRRPPVIATVILLLLVPGVFFAVKSYPLLKPFLSGHKSPLMFSNRQFDKQYPAFTAKFTKNLLAFPFRVKDIGMFTPYTPDLLEKSGFGIQFFAFGLLAYLLLLPLVVFKKEYRNSVMGFLLIFAILLLTAYFFFYFSWANYRSFMFFAIIGLMLWAYIQSRWINKNYYRFFIDILLVLMILFNGLVCFYEGNQYPERWKTTMTTSASHHRSVIKYSNLLKTWNGPGKSWDFIDFHIPPDQAIAFNGGEDGWTFPYFGNRLQRNVFYLASLPGFQAERIKKGDTVYRIMKFTRDFRTSLKQRGIHYIHFSTQGTPHRQKLQIPTGTPGVTEITPHLYYVEWETVSSEQ